MTRHTRNQDLEEETKTLRISDPDLLEESRTPQPGADRTTKTSSSSTSRPYRFIPLQMGGNGGTHVVSDGSASLIHEVSLEQLQQMTEFFYEKVFQDPTLDKFIRSHDDPHGTRFAKWIHQKLSGSSVWDDDRRARDLSPVSVAGGRQTVVHDRSSAHAAAWYSPKRPKKEVGRHFKLDECRVWMRLHFWSMRQAGLVKYSPSFASYYVRFLGHFVRVYESTAPMFARDSFRWSADPKNIQKYLDNGRKMTDVIGVNFERALSQLPESEADDFEWPYNQTEEGSEPQAW